MPAANSPAARLTSLKNRVAPAIHRGSLLPPRKSRTNSAGGHSFNPWTRSSRALGHGTGNSATATSIKVAHKVAHASGRRGGRAARATTIKGARRLAGALNSTDVTIFLVTALW